MNNLKYSKQRESILAFLATRKDHPTADTVYTNIREQFPKISLGTVYRNLALLSDIGEIMKITTGDGADRFDFNTNLHHHFLCKECHNVIDLDMDSIDEVVDVAQMNFGGKIDTYVTLFTGTCENCIKKL